MSSILKALKKIDSRKAETELPIWPYGINDRESMSRHTNRTRHRHKILGILIVVCTVALAGKLYFGSRNTLESIAPGPDLSVKSALPTVSGEKPKTDRLRAESRGTPTTNRLRNEANTEPKTEPAPPSPTAAFRSPPPHTTPDTSHAEAVSDAAIEAPRTAPKDNAGLILQALVWSEQPEDRFVVINGSILREGGVINGSVISGIESDYVTVRSDGTTWRLTY